MPAAAAMRGPTLVQGNLVQPRLEASTTRELPKVGIGMEKGHLHDIRSLRVITDEAVDESVERFLVAFDQHVEIGAPPGKRASNEGGIIHGRGPLHLARSGRGAGVPLVGSDERT